MKLGPEGKRRLVTEISRFTSGLRAKEVARSQVQVVARALRANPDRASFEAVLELLPRSSFARFTDGGQPKFEVVCTSTRDLLRRLPGIVGADRSIEALAYVLGTVGHLLPAEDGDRGGDRGRDERRRR